MSNPGHFPGGGRSYITREKYRKYLWKKSQVFHDILAIWKSLRHHTCDFCMRFFRVYLRFSSYLRYFVWNHTCDFFRKYASRNHKYGGPKGPLARNIASMPRLKSQVYQHYAKTKSQACWERITSMPIVNRKYSKSKSQVCQSQITSMSKSNRKCVTVCIWHFRKCAKLI